MNKAYRMRELAVGSVMEEINILDNLIWEAAKNGNLYIVVDKISDAAKWKLEDSGYQIKTELEKAKEIGIADKYRIIWGSVKI